MTSKAQQHTGMVQNSVALRAEVAEALDKASESPPAERGALIQVAQTWKGLADIAFAEEQALQKLANQPVKRSAR